MIVHLETRIVTIFGVLDNEGNVTQRIMVQPDANAKADPLQVQVLNEASFVAAHTALQQVKASLVKQEAEALATQQEPVLSSNVDVENEVK